MKTNITIHLDVEDLNAAIEEYLDKRGWTVADTISLNLEARTGESHFSGADVPVVRKKGTDCN